MIVVCVNNNKCENFLDLGKKYEAVQSVIRDGYYTIKVDDKLGRFSSLKADFKKCRFV